MPFDNEPEFNKVEIGTKVPIELPVYTWVTIGEWLQFISDNTKYTFPVAMHMLLSNINDILFPPAFQKAQKAMWEEHKQQHIESHPFMQAMKGFPGVHFESIPDLETFDDGPYNTIENVDSDDTDDTNGNL